MLFLYVLSAHLLLLLCVFQGFELMLLSLADPSERVVSAVHQVFIPAFAAWTTELGTLHTALIPSLLARIEKLLMVSVCVYVCVFLTENLSLPNDVYSKVCLRFVTGKIFAHCLEK